MMSRSLRSSNRSENDYLSEVLSQQNDENITEISSDLIESTKYLENQFKTRYLILKNAYENRIQQLSMTLEETCNQIASNEIIDSLKEDLTSSIFIPSIIQEIFLTHLKSDRERYILEILQKENELKILLQNQQEICQNQNLTILSLENEVQRGREANEIIIKMREQITNLTEQYKQMSLKAQEEISTSIHEKDATILRETSLQQQLTHLNESLQVQQFN